MPPRDTVVLFQQRLGLPRHGYVDVHGGLHYLDDPWKEALPELVSWWTEGPDPAPLRTEWKEVAL